MSKLSTACPFPSKMSCDSLVLLGPCVHREQVSSNKLTLLYKNDCFSLCQSVIWSVLSHEEIYLNICRNVRGVLTFLIHCMYIKYIRFGLFGFYGISTIVGYLMPNLLYTYVLNILDLVGLGFMAYQPL